MTTYILGAGPTGMAVADGLMDTNNNDFVVLEKGRQLGGLAQTLQWQGVGAHDLGPHKIFSLDPQLINRVESLLPETEWLTREKISSIYMNGYYLPYPPSPFSLVGVFGLFTFIGMVIGYACARLTSILGSYQPRTFEEDLVSRLGAPLYKVLFRPIAQKLWGDPRTLDVKLSRGRVQTPSLFEVLGRLLKLKKHSRFEALTFRYPKGGLARLWAAIESKSNAVGQFMTEHEVTRLIAIKGRVREIHYVAKKEEGVFHLGDDDFVVSTLPLSFATRLLSGCLPPHLPNLVADVVGLNDLLLVFLHVDQTSLINESWVFVPDPEIVFHRLSEQESFDPDMTPNGSIVCCEILSGESRPLASYSDDKLSALSIQGLADMGYSGFTVLDKRVIRLPKSYPVFRTGFERGLDEIISELDELKNFRTLGRQGAFNYIGTLDAMDIGYGFAQWITGGQQKMWQCERERTSHYPVLD